MSNSAPGCGCPMAAKVRHCTGRAGRPCRIVTRWCAFAPKVDSCARPPAAWAINDRPQFLDSEREIGTTQIDRASVHRVARSATLL